VNVNFFGTLNLNGNDIINVSKILGMDGKWKIDEDGTMTAVRVVTDELIAQHLAISESVKFGTPEKRIGITIYDEATGSPYCMKIRNGAMISEAGECGLTPLTTGTESDTNVPISESATEVSPLSGGETSSTTIGVLPPSGGETSTTETSAPADEPISKSPSSEPETAPEPEPEPEAAPGAVSEEPTGETVTSTNP
jgi:hypothetical protein